MPAHVRRTAAIAATIPVLAALVLAAAPFASAGIVVQSATVTIVKVTDPAVDAQDFEFSINDGPFGGITLDTDPTSDDVDDERVLLLGSEAFGEFTITEGNESAWMLTHIECSGATEEFDPETDSVSFDVDNGDDIMCTFYNAKRAQLTLEKETEPGNDPQDFFFDLTGGAVPAEHELDTDPNSDFTGSSLTWSVWADDLGAYTITERAVTGWLLMELECTGAGSDSSVNLETRTATLDIDAGELITCTFTNGKLPLLRLTKVTDPASDPQDFYLDVKSVFNTSLDTDPTSVDTHATDWTSLADDELGPRVIEETEVPGWTLTNVSCPGDAEAQPDLSDNRVVLDVDADENIHCTFTNTKDSDETEPPATDEPTDEPGEPTIEPTDDIGGETNAATEPGTSTESKTSDASPVGMGVALVALILLGGVLLLTRPKRAGK